MQNHSLPTPIDGLPVFGAALSAGSSVRWARTPARTCLIFVHGYGGRATKTWGDFPDLAMENSAFAQVDMVFLGYESRSRTAAFNVGVIYQIVLQLAQQPATVLEQARGPQRPGWSEYKKIILIGHSLGGALIRDVAMSAKTQGKAWAEKLQLALFAPAHMGASILDLAQMSFGILKWAPLPQAAAYLVNPVLRDLATGSDYLNTLLTTARTIGKHCTTEARFVAHAAGDKIVVQNTFYLDPPLLPYDGQNHVSCCKPVRQNFERPVLDVAEILA
jgi:triacylglycerol esterase/lipase EstA (alpha/beta hydrolase family)